MSISVQKGLAFCAMAILGFVLFFQLIKLSLYKNFSIDEFTYAHAGWLIAKGNLPYRDFFSHHLPLGYFVFSIPFLSLGDNPSNIIYQRFLMWPFVLISFFSACFINRFHTRGFYWFTGIILLSIPTFTIFATEIRPDLMALATFSLALSICYTNANNRIPLGLTIGCFVGISVCFSEKVLFYGSVIMIGFLIDSIYNSKKNKGFMVGEPKAVALGALSVVSLYFIFLLATDSFENWLKHSLQFTLDYQNIYDGFSWQIFFWPSLTEVFCLLPLALLGALHSFLKWFHSGEMRWRDPELLILLGAFSTLFSYLFQKQPFPYSLMPFFLFTAIYTWRGILVIFTTLNKTRSWMHYIPIAILFFSGVVYFIRINYIFYHRLNRDNSYQLNALKWIENNTSPSDSFYDNSGSYIARPHASFYYFTNAFMRQHWVEFLNTNVPYSIEKNGATVFINDSRHDSLPENLRLYLDKNFFPLDNNFWIWGKKFQKVDFEDGAQQFHAIRTGRYFVCPQQVAQEGSFTVDGKEIQEQVFTLNRGYHNIEYSGTLEEFHLIWLPRNEKPFFPIESTASDFVPIF